MNRRVAIVIAAGTAYSLTAGASAGLAYVANVTTAGPLTVNIAVTQSVMIGGVDHISATISISGFAPGSAIQGFIGTAATPWAVTTQAAGFWNAPSAAPFWNGNQSFAADASLEGFGVPNAQWDSGLLPTAPFNTSPFGQPSSEAGFGVFTDGGSETADPWAWISINSAGVPVGAGQSIGVLRVTWMRGFGNEASGSFVIAMNTPELSQDVSWWVGILPTPGTLALLGMAGLSRPRRRR